MAARAIMVRRGRHLVQTTLLLGAMAVIVAAMGWMVAGLAGLVWTAIIGSAVLIVGPGLSVRVLLRLYGALPLSVNSAPGLVLLVARLAARAGLAQAPRLFYVADPGMLAVTLGRPGRSYIMVSEGLIRLLTVRELAAVLAHEIAHIQHRDLLLMMIGDILIRLARAIAFAGLAMLLINIPLYAFGRAHLSWLLPAFLLLAPGLIGLLRLGLSRTREYDADLGAVALTGDAAGLAMALRKLERYDISLVERILMPGTHRRIPTLLRTHPEIAARIGRLERMAPTADALVFPSGPASTLIGRAPPRSIRLRWHP